VIYDSDGRIIRRQIGFARQYTTERERPDGDRVVAASGMMTNAPESYWDDDACRAGRSDEKRRGK
jgi:hypothetical protein